MDRVKTGIPGFDELISGGIPEGFNVLLFGYPGVGKTIFGLQYLINGALKGEKGVYISLNGSKEMTKNQAKQFGWDLDAMEKEGSLSFLKIPLDKPKINLFDILEEEVKSTGVKRLVFDSIADFAINIDQFVTTLDYADPNPVWNAILHSDDQAVSQVSKEFRMPVLDQDPKGRVLYKGHSKKRIAYLVINELGKLGTTNLVITDERQGGENLTIDGVSEYCCDGLVRLGTLDTGGQTARTLRVLKMRTSKISMDYKRLEITPNGIVIS